MGVLYMTILRRRQEFGMTETPGGNISDNELNEFIQELRKELPALGQTIVWGRLRSLGFRVNKLVMWRFVTHCAIDGYSRLILFL